MEEPTKDAQALGFQLLPKDKDIRTTYLIIMNTLSQRSFLHVCLVLVFSIKSFSSTKISSPDCSRLQRIKVNHSLYLLCRMGGQFPLSCLNDRTDFRIPREIFIIRKKENALMIIHELLHHIFQLFSKNLPQGAWNPSCIEKFQNGLHWQIEQLEKCFGGEMQQATRNWKNGLLQNNILKAKKYFQRISHFLNEKNYSRCSWETARMEMRRCFLFLDHLLKNLRN
ncbi:interferon alpha-7-like [Alligator mississippiensis]|uniref:interferon alpha-7-like n=1 Tax=Alligator mississippiensis TaxID=8496 RepID=UPI0003D0C4D4|nr:interferon alpha-7-like [Alligator mississippiensis]